MNKFTLAVILLLTGIASAGGTSYVHGANGLIAKVNESGVFYIHSDHLGSTSAMTDEDGEVVEKQKNLPFGELLEGSEKYGFTGKERDETGLQYFGARYYNPGSGRFLSVDSVKDGINWYSYAANNPLRYIDPTGNMVARSWYQSTLEGDKIFKSLLGGEHIIRAFPPLFPNVIGVHVKGETKGLERKTYLEGNEGLSVYDDDTNEEIPSGELFSEFIGSSGWNTKVSILKKQITSTRGYIISTRTGVKRGKIPGDYIEAFVFFPGIKGVPDKYMYYLYGGIFNYFRHGDLVTDFWISVDIHDLSKKTKGIDTTFHKELSDKYNVHIMRRDNEIGIVGPSRIIENYNRIINNEGTWGDYKAMISSDNIIKGPIAEKILRIVNDVFIKHFREESLWFPKRGAINSGFRE